MVTVRGGKFKNVTGMLTKLFRTLSGVVENGIMERSYFQPDAKSRKSVDI